MTDTAASTSPPTFRLIYRSHSRIRRDDRDTALAEIFTEARSNNKKTNITGALLITDNWFVQALEGERSAVQSLYERISSDDRHHDLSVVQSGPVDSRAFPRWAMAQVSSSGRADIPLHVREGQIHVAAGHPVTRDQSAVLKVMRDTVGADVL